MRSTGLARLSLGPTQCLRQNSRTQNHVHGVLTELKFLRDIDDAKLRVTPDPMHKAAIALCILRIIPPYSIASPCSYTFTGIKFRYDL